MKKFLFFFCLVGLFTITGCTQKPVTNEVKIQTDTTLSSDTVQTDNTLDSLSPLSALLQQMQVGIPEGEYPRITNIRMVSDATAGFHPESFTVTYTEEGLADDEVSKVEYTLKLQKQSDGTWKVIDKKLTKSECYPGRCLEK